MAKTDWDTLASICEANHDLYEASVTGDEKLAHDAIKRGAELCHVVQWLDDVESINFFMKVQLAPFSRQKHSSIPPADFSK